MPKSRSPAHQKARRNTKLTIEQIHVDELLSAAGMSGYLAVLDPPVQTPHLDRLASEMLEEIKGGAPSLPGRYQAAQTSSEVANTETGAPSLGIPDSGAPISAAPAIPAPAMGTPEAGIPETRAPYSASAPVGHIISRTPTTPQSSTPEGGVGERGIPYSFAPIVRRPTIRQATLVQDGHSYGEQLVYQTLWDNATPHTSEGRLITIGYRTLSSLCRLTVNNCKANLIALQQKLAIQELSSHSPTQGKTYLVYSFTAILMRRRGAGLTHYIKTRGVAFVNPQTGEPLPHPGTPVSGIPPTERGVPVAGPPKIDEGTPASGLRGIPASGPPTLDTLSRVQAATPSSSSPLRDAVQIVDAIADDDVLRQLVAACYRVAPDVSEEEIAWLVRQKTAQCLSSGVRNPIGFLLTTVPRLLEGDGLRRLRVLRTRQNESPYAMITDIQVEMRALLEDPAATEDDRRFARHILGITDPSS